jgi:hypothetical protein
LTALQRAFDRRWYFLRTLPERTRIDPGRRLSGERSEARSWVRDAQTSSASPSLGPMSDLMRALEARLRPPPLGLGASEQGSLTAAGQSDLPTLAARLGALAPGDPDVQSAAINLAAAAGKDGREQAEAIRAAMGFLSARATALLAGPARAMLPADPIAGRFADERGMGGRR